MCEYYAERCFFFKLQLLKNELINFLNFRFFEDFLTDMFSDEKLATYLLNVESLLFETQGDDNSNLFEDNHDLVFSEFLQKIIQDAIPSKY